MDVNDLIGYLIRDSTSDATDPAQLLHSIQSDARTGAEIAAQYDTNRSTVYRNLTRLVDPGLVRQDESAFELTAAGAIVNRTYRRTIDRIGRGDLAFLASSQHRASLLRVLRNQPERIAGLADLSDEGPSRSTIQCSMSTFREQNWIIKNGDGCYELTPSGESTIQVYQRFKNTVEQVLDKNACLRNLEAECRALPAQHLQGERIVTATPTNPFKGRNAYLNFLDDLDEDSFDYVRMFSTYFDAEFAEAFSPFIEAGVTVDIVSPEAVLGNSPSGLKELKYIKQGFVADHVQWHIYPGAVPCGLVVFDDEWAVLGPADLENVSRVSASIFAADEIIIEWAATLYDEYLDGAERPPGDVLQRIYRKINNSLESTRIMPVSSDSNC